MKYGILADSRRLITLDFFDYRDSLTMTDIVRVVSNAFDGQVQLNDISGNRIKIIVRDVSSTELKKNIINITLELNKKIGKN